MEHKDPIKQERLEQANELLRLIAHSGRKFFAHNGRVSRFEFDYRGRIWFVDAYRETRIYTHAPNSNWRGFSEGGTLHAAVLHLRDYIRTGKQTKDFGPWPDWYSNGDPWGYGSDMLTIRDAAIRLGIAVITHS
jgi:hypothetical protein